MNRIALVAVVLCLIGCEKRRERTVNAVAEDDRSYIAMVVLDLSGSFTHLMAEKGKGYEFALSVVDRYFRDRIGTNDRLIIAQISGTNRPLLWEGTPQELRQRFTSAGKFRDFLLARADPNASFVHDGLAHSLDYLMSDARVASGKAKSAVFVLSDMVENGPNPVESKQRLLGSLSAYGKLKGVMGMYYVDQFLVGDWRQQVRAAGFEHYIVESEIHEKPTLPDFE